MNAINNFLDVSYNTYKENAFKTVLKLKDELSKNQNNNFNFLLMGFLNRSISNYHAYKSLIAVDNYAVSIAVMRMQLDIVLKLALAQIVIDKEKFAEHIIKNGKAKTYRDSATKEVLKNNVTDTLLAKLIDSWAKYP